MEKRNGKKLPDFMDFAEYGSGWKKERRKEIKLDNQKKYFYDVTMGKVIEANNKKDRRTES